MIEIVPSGWSTLWGVGYLICWPISTVWLTVASLNNRYLGRGGAVRADIWDVAAPCGCCAVLALFWPVIVVLGLVFFPIFCGATWLVNLVIWRQAVRREEVDA